eukprot:m.9860 g.9860  ORF g.9860 m.9860 type:complete len:501 (-) comp7034_c0_seq1:351-1853(-)
MAYDAPPTADIVVSLHRHTPQEHARAVRGINLIFFLFATLAIFDLATDINMTAIIATSAKEFEDFKSANFVGDPACSASGDALIFSEAKTKCSSSLCQSFEIYSDQRTDAMCHVDEYTAGSMNRATGNATIDACRFSKEFDATLKKLQDLRISYVVFLIVSVLLTGYYLYALRKKYYARLSLLPLVSVPGEDEFGENLLKPYFAPPDPDNWPGRPAAPYYDDKSAQKRVDKNKASIFKQPKASCVGCEARDRAREVYCRVCGRAADADDYITPTAQRVLRSRYNAEKNSRRVRFQNYVAGFISTLGARFVTMILEDMPQAIMVVMYVVYIDKPSGLSCLECSFNGNVCDFGTDYNTTAVYLVLGGQVASIVLLFGQALYMKQMEQIRSKRAELGDTSLKFDYCGVDMLLLLIIIPGFIAPIIITILVTDMRIILGIMPPDGTSFIVLLVLAIVFTIPWMGAFALLVVALSLQAGCDQCCGDWECCSGCDCCDCLDCCCCC